MKISFTKGRLGKHRFHPMLVHFPTALYPFSLALDVIGVSTGRLEFANAACYALVGALIMTAPAAAYGTSDFLKLRPDTAEWKAAGVHALLNCAWLIGFCLLFFWRIKHEVTLPGTIYLSITSLLTVGLFVSNYLGADLIIKFKVLEKE